jgi:hypothetical protein
MSPSIEAIWEKVKQNDFELSKHAVVQSIIKGILIAEIKEATFFLMNLVFGQVY